MRQTIANPTVRARLQSWPRDPTIRHLVLLDVEMTPTVDDVAGWIDDVFGVGSASVTDGTVPTRIRTGALFPSAARSFLSCGFVEIDRLALLELPLVEPPRRRRTTRADVALRRMRQRDLAVAATIDDLAFDAGWTNSVESLDEISRATPQSRLRLAVRSGTRRHLRAAAVGFSITGRAGPTAYLQRLAVEPDERRRGVGRTLVDDAIGWSTRRGATRLLVNTAIDNAAALALYERFGFRRLRDDLVVLERQRHA